MPTFNHFTLKLLFLGIYRKQSLMGINSNDRSYSILSMLAPPTSSLRAAYDTYVTQHEQVLTESFVVQRKKSDTTTFYQSDCSSLEHVVTAIANSDMLSRYRFTYAYHEKLQMPLQIFLLRRIVGELTNVDTKK